MKPVLLVLRALGLGDFLTGVPAYRALARAFPTHRRVLAAPRALHALLPLLGGAFDAAVDANPLEPLGEHAPAPDVAVNLHGCGPQSHALLAALGPRRLIAFAHPAVPESASNPRWCADEHEVLRWCRLLTESGIPADPADLDLAAPLAPAPPAFAGATIVHPGAASASRRWPAERFAAVARHCARRGDTVIVTGAPQERALTAEVRRLAHLPREADLGGRTNVLELAALVAGAGRLISGDTGVAHLASAYRVPSLVLFGPVSPAQWGPPRRAQHRTLWAGRNGDPHAPQTDPGLRALATRRVLRELSQLPARVENRAPLP